MYNIHRYYSLRRYLITKIEYFKRKGYNFPHISQTNTTFKTGFRIMTYEYYLKQPKSMMEGKLKEKLAGNPKLMQDIYMPIYDPLTHHNFNIKGKNQDLD